MYRPGLVYAGRRDAADLVDAQQYQLRYSHQGAPHLMKAVDEINQKMDKARCALG